MSASYIGHQPTCSININIGPGQWNTHIFNTEWVGSSRLSDRLMHWPICSECDFWVTHRNYNSINFRTHGDKFDRLGYCCFKTVILQTLETSQSLRLAEWSFHPIKRLYMNPSSSPISFLPTPPQTIHCTVDCHFKAPVWTVWWPFCTCKLASKIKIKSWLFMLCC